MFNELKSRLNTDNAKIEKSSWLLEMADPMEDDVLDSIALPAGEEKKIEELISKIPDDDFITDENITDSELNQASTQVADPMIEELLDDGDM